MEFGRSCLPESPRFTKTLVAVTRLCATTFLPSTIDISSFDHAEYAHPTPLATSIMTTRATRSAASDYRDRPQKRRKTIARQSVDTALDLTGDTSEEHNPQSSAPSSDPTDQQWLAHCILGERNIKVLEKGKKIVKKQYQIDWVPDPVTGNYEPTWVIFAN